MNCPLDNSKLDVTERNGIELRVCPNCHGVWLDKIELDKIIQHGRVASKRTKELKKVRHLNRAVRGSKEKSFLVDLFYF